MPSLSGSIAAMQCFRFLFHDQLIIVAKKNKDITLLARNPENLEPRRQDKIKTLRQNIDK